MELVTVDKIERLANSNHSFKYKDIAIVFLAGLNDWPHNTNDLFDFEAQLHKFIKMAPTKLSMVYFLENNSFRSSAWEQEALYELLGVYKYYKAETPLRNIIEDLANAIYKM